MSRCRRVSAAVVAAVLCAAAGAAAAPIDVRPDAVRAVGERQLERASVARLVRRGFALYCGGELPFVALTFDDGPGPLTPALLALLEAERAPATFFVIGDQVPDQAWLVAEEARIGAVGDHTWDHGHLARMSLWRARTELSRTKRLLLRTTMRPVSLYRPPYENWDPQVARVGREEGLLEVLWSADSRDWQLRSPQLVESVLRPALRPGAIVLFHEHGPAVVPALRWTLRHLRLLGLRPVTVPQLLALDPPSLAELRVDARARECVRLAAH